MSLVSSQLALETLETEAILKYEIGQLRVDLDPEAATHNDSLLGPDTLGIEVTVTPLAKRCGLGNIDPQHSEGKNLSAIEQAMWHPVPVSCKRLVTVRLDRDSLGAMAVLLLRADGRADKIDRFLVSWIGAVDRMGYDNAKRSFPDLQQPSFVTDAMQTIIRNIRWPRLSDKVLAITKILAQEITADELYGICRLKDTSSKELFSAEEYGEYVGFTEAPEELDRARNQMNRRYPVAVIFDPRRWSAHAGTQPRWSVVRQIGCFDRSGFVAAINVAEASARGMNVAELIEAGASWGGPENIVSSPQGQASKLSKKEILEIVCRHAENGVVS